MVTSCLLKRGNTMFPDAVTALVITVTLLVIPTAVQPLPTRQDGSSTFRDCNCLPNLLNGRLLIADLRSINHDAADRLLLISQLHKSNQNHLKQQVTTDLEVFFQIDFIGGLIVFEFSHRRDRNPKSGTNDGFNRWSIVVDLDDRSDESTARDQQLTAALIYLVDLDSNNVWNIGNGMIGGGRTQLRGRRSYRQYSVNRCPMRGKQPDYIDGVGPVYIMDYKSSSPLILTTTSESCLPQTLSDSNISVIFEVEKELERSSLQKDTAELRALIKQKNKGSGDYVIESQLRRHQSATAAAAAALIIQWLLREESESQSPFIGCCSPPQWQASITKSIVYKLGNNIHGSQTTMMDRVYVDHESHSIAGSLYNLVNNEPTNNSTFLAVSDRTVSQSMIIYVVDTSTNSCIAANFTDLQRTDGSNCLTEDKANLTSEITVGLQLTVYGWTKSMQGADGSYKGSSNIYVTLVDDEIDESRRHQSSGRGQGESSLPQCVMVSQMTEWSSTAETFSDLAFVYNTELGIPDGVFKIPPSCVGVPVVVYSDTSLSPSLQYTLSLASSL